MSVRELRRIARHRQALNVVTFDQSRHQTEELCLVDELAQEHGRGLVGADRTDCLLNGNVAAVENSGARKVVQV